MKIKILLLVLFFQIFISAQNIQLRGKVLDEKREPIPNLSLRFTTFGETVTTGSGEFVITIPQDVRSVDITIADENWQLLYPVDSKIPVPNDPSFINTILAAKTKSDNNDINISAERFSELEKLLKETGSTNQELQDFLKRFVELEAKRLEIDELKLMETFKKREKRDEIFTTISPLFSELILRLKNLKTYFEMNYELAFTSEPANQVLNKATRAYNPLYDSINNNYKKWEKNISESWSENLSERFLSAVNYFIDEIHKQYIFQLNEAIKDINKVRFIVEDDDERDEIKRRVRMNVNSIVKNLEIKIPVLEDRLNEFLTRLQYDDMN